MTGRMIYTLVLAHPTESYLEIMMECLFAIGGGGLLPSGMLFSLFEEVFEEAYEQRRYSLVLPLSSYT